MSRFALVIAICWIVFLFYWIVSSFKSKRNTVPKNIGRFVGARLSIIVFALVFSIIYRSMPESFRDHSWASNTALQLIALVVFLLGIALAFWARFTMGEDWGMPMTEKQKPELVTSGPFQYIRHPIYSGFLLMALGSAVDVNSYWAIVFLVSLLFFIYSAFSEEKMLKEQFPEAYPLYMAKTKRLIPFVF